MQLTPTGQHTLHRAEQAREETERQFLSPLSRSDANHLVRALQTLVAAPKTVG